MTRLALAGALTAPLLIGGASAQEAGQGGDGAASGGTPDPIVRMQDPGELRMEWIGGSTVVSPEGETIGTVEDVIIDRETGEVTAAVIAFGGLFGFGAKQIAVAWQDVGIDSDAREITLDITPRQAEDAPAYVFRDRARAAEEMPTDAAGTGTGESVD